MLNHSVINDCDNIYLCQCTDGVYMYEVVKVRPVCMHASAITCEKYLTYCNETHAMSVWRIHYCASSLDVVYTCMHFICV